MRKSVVVDFLPESVARYRDGYAIVAIDVCRATTTAISAVAAGRRCYPVPTVAAAFALADQLGNALLAGEQRGIVPPGFDLNNSPVELLARSDIDRPLVLLSSSGTRLCHEATNCDAAFVACFRNYAALAAYLARSFPKVAVIGAGTRGEFREEDQMCCAWVAESLLAAGYEPEGDDTAVVVERWSQVPVDAWTFGKSAAYLRNSGQIEDLDFILRHVGDLTTSFMLRDGEVVAVPTLRNPAFGQDMAQLTDA
jgi:2-phosphosulfolactate phosphatase